MTAPPLWAETLLHEVRAVARRLEHIEARLALAPAMVAGDPVAALRAEAAEMDIPIVLGGFVAEAGAARLCGRSAACLKNWRQIGRPIARPQKLLGRWHYSISDLAEICPEEFEENAL